MNIQRYYFFFLRIKTSKIEWNNIFKNQNSKKPGHDCRNKAKNRRRFNRSVTSYFTERSILFWKKATAIREDNVGPQRQRAAQKETGTVFPSIARAYARQTALTYGWYRLCAVRRSYFSPTRAVVEFVSMTTRVSVHSLGLSLKKWKRAYELWTREKRRKKEKTHIYIHIYISVKL